MTKDRTNVRIYGDLASGVWVAPKGTTGPVDLTAPAVAYKELGWLSDAGVDLDRAANSNDFFAWQGGTRLRTKITSVGDTFHVQCLEENLVTTGLYYKGQAWTVTGTAPNKIATLSVTNQTVGDERAWVADFIDAGVTKRIIVPSGEVTDRATMGHNNAGTTIYDLTVTIYGDYTVITNVASIAV
jgi:hypothetical protein